ncbi:MAG: hypothetical protein IJE46_01220 [Clostridia bacterium]|nr:hypothetical protein [Clostridia bacterium]
MKCKRIIKVVSALALTLALLVSSGVVSFAASYTTTTNYLNQGTIEVTSRAFGLDEGDMATYVAYNGNGFSEANAVYIDQATADDTRIVTFTYQADSDDVKATVKFGGKGTTVTPDKEGYEIAVTVNGELSSTEVVPTVDAAYTFEGDEDFLAREIPVSLVAGQAVNAVTFTAEGAADATTVDAWYVKDGAIVVLSNVIRSNGTLAITTEEAEVSVRIGDVVAGTGKITAFAKAVCADDADYGIILATEDADISTTVSFEEAGDYTTAVKLPALGKGADGGFCVEVEDDQLVAGTNYKVAAYAVDKVTPTKVVTAQ